MHKPDMMDKHTALYFRDQLRAGRDKAFRDAEAFHEILYAVESLGSTLIGDIGSLWSYRKAVIKLAQASPLSDDIPSQWREWHLPFPDLLEIVRDARNDALHQGAYARHLTVHASQLALVLEDALMNNAITVSDFMVHEPVVAHLWQPLSIIRQRMLVNSFTYLPILIENDNQDSGWYLIPDRSLAHYLRSASSKNERKRRLAQTVEAALKASELELSRARIFPPETPVQEALTEFTGEPLLIVHPERADRLLGILTAFDLL